MSNLTTFAVQYVDNENHDQLRLIDARCSYDARKRAAEYPDCYLVVAVVTARGYEQGKGDKPAPGDHDYLESHSGCFISAWTVFLCLLVLAVYVVLILLVNK